MDFEDRTLALSLRLQVPVASFTPSVQARCRVCCKSLLHWETCLLPHRASCRREPCTRLSCGLQSHEREELPLPSRSGASRHMAHRFRATPAPLPRQAAGSLPSVVVYTFTTLRAGLPLTTPVDSTMFYTSFTATRARMSCYLMTLGLPHAGSTLPCTASRTRFRLAECSSCIRPFRVTCRCPRAPFFFPDTRRFRSFLPSSSTSLRCIA